MTNKNQFGIIGDNPRRSKYDPNLADEFNKKVEDEERRRQLEEKLGRGKPRESEQPAPMRLDNSRINPSEYIQIPQYMALIGEGLFMPTIPIYMTHYLNTRDASQGKTDLYDANGAQLSNSEVNKHWNQLSKDCWTWLDAMFSLENGIWKITDKIQGKADLADCLKEDGFADLDSLNNQKLPKKSSGKQEYSQLNNILFYHPSDGAVARFYANSGRAGLYCYRNRDLANDSLGVRPCASLEYISKILEGAK